MPPAPVEHLNAWNMAKKCNALTRLFSPGEVFSGKFCTRCLWLPNNHILISETSVSLHTLYTFLFFQKSWHQQIRILFDDYYFVCIVKRKSGYFFMSLGCPITVDSVRLFNALSSEIFSKLKAHTWGVKRCIPFLLFWTFEMQLKMARLVQCEGLQSQWPEFFFEEAAHYPTYRQSED